MLYLKRFNITMLNEERINVLFVEKNWHSKKKKY